MQKLLNKKYNERFLTNIIGQPEIESNTHASVLLLVCIIRLS